ncbi:hypothetical protein, partial [Acinetobacter baumannii]|uniref:hypothetical protein n=1 Tax=Acinetobacter baumannii TaxID=470 RepID=UPI001BB24446
LIHLKIILWNKPLEIGLCNKATLIQFLTGLNLSTFCCEKSMDGIDTHPLIPKVITNPIK